MWAGSKRTTCRETFTSLSSGEFVAIFISIVIHKHCYSNIYTSMKMQVSLTVHEVFVVCSKGGVEEAKVRGKGRSHLSSGQTSGNLYASS